MAGMMRTTMDNRDDHPSFGLLGQALALLEQSWQRDEPSRMNSVLNRFPSLAGDNEAMLRLIAADARQCLANSHSLNVADYLVHAPHLQTEIEQLLDAIRLPATSSPCQRDIQPETVDLKAAPTPSTTDPVLPRHPQATAAAQPARVGRYDIRETLGAGTFGTVYLAHDEDLNRHVAIKMPRHAPAAGFSSDAFRNEARNLASLSHPNLLAVYDFGLHGQDLPFIVTEYLAGETLKHRLANGSYDKLQATRVIRDIAQALHYVHRRAYVHRDVKPENILFDQEGRPKIVDFGLALFEGDQIQRRGEVAGTPAYMAPEQVDGLSHHLDGRCDIWSLGVILYEIWAGVRPFRGTNTSDLFEQIRKRDPKPLRMIGDTPAPLAALITRCLEKPVSRRLASAQELAEGLDQCLRAMAEPSPSGALRDPSHVGQYARPFRAAMLVVMLFVLGGGGVALWRWDHNHRQQANLAARADGRQVKSRPSNPPLGDAGHAAPLEGDVTIRLWNNDVASRRGLVLEHALPLISGDAIRVDVSLSRPAYLYLIWLAQDGLTPLYPWKPGNWDRLPKSHDKVRHVSLPQARDEGWPMQASSSMETILLLASDSPLDDFDFLGSLKGYPVPRAPSKLEVIRLDDKPATAADSGSTGQPDLRSPLVQPVKLNDDQQAARAFLQRRLSGKFELLRAKGFSSLPVSSP